MDTVHFDRDEFHALSLVGRIVTFRNEQYMVRNCEGYDWYAFVQDGQIAIDRFTVADKRMHHPELGLLPTGAGPEAWAIPASRVHPGVCLIKSYR